MFTLQTISLALQILALLSVIVGVVFFIIREWRKKNNEYDKETIGSLQNAVSALEKERDILKQENAELKGKLAAMQETLSKNEKDISMLKDLATGATKLDGLIAMFNETNVQKIDALQEIRQMIRDDRKATEENNKVIGKLKTILEKHILLHEERETAAKVIG